MGTERLDPTMQACWATVEANAATIERRPQATVRPATHEPSSSGKRALALLAGQDDLVLEGTLGEGGMGVVRLGTQTSLGRKVAIKTLKEAGTPGMVMKLLREAWVTGSLEHPNILPIHDLRLDDTGRPLVVLKRIEGTDWSEMMRDAEAMRARFGSGDLLAHNLHVLMQVCRAVSFAHSRGIVHRDLKPDNIRIGEFGEVYVLDWGLAVALEDDGSGRFPLVSEAREMAGTPAYMAPEMLGEEDEPRISQATDVYLLGAILYEILTGAPPHHAPTAVAIVSSVLRSDPPISEEHPAELIAIVKRAMRADPAERFASADELRLAIDRFLAHRGSLALTEQALARLAALERHLDRVGDDSDRRVRAYDLFGECRFGFAEALAAWPDNHLARDGLGRAVGAMIELELERGDARAARALYEQLASSSPALADRIEAGIALQEQAERRQRELEKLGQDLDKSIGTRTRMFVMAVCCAIWTVAPLFGHAYLRQELETSFALNLGLAVGMLAFATALIFWARDSLSKTAVNRRTAGGILLMLFAQALLFIGGWYAGMSLVVVQVLLLFVWALTTGIGGVTMDRRLFPSAAAHGIGFLIAARWPTQRFFVMALANLVTTLNFVVMWRPARLFEPKD